MNLVLILAVGETLVSENFHAELLERGVLRVEWMTDGAKVLLHDPVEFMRIIIRGGNSDGLDVLSCFLVVCEQLPGQRMAAYGFYRMANKVNQMVVCRMFARSVGDLADKGDILLDMCRESIVPFTLSLL